MTDEVKITGTSGQDGTYEIVEFKPSPEAAAAADAALGEMKDRSFSARNAQLGKMINCYVCGERHRSTAQVTYREHRDENGKKTVTLEFLKGPCEANFVHLWVDEDLETGELSIQKAIVPLPGQKGTVKAIVGAAFVAKKRKKRHPNQTGLQIVQITRELMKFVNKENFTNEQSQMLEARRMAVNTLRNRREKEAKRIRKQQKNSRRINRGNR